MALVHCRGRFMRRVLADLGVTRRSVGVKHRRECVTALLGQSNAESGTEPCNGVPGQGARYNPLNTTYDLAPNTLYNSAGVRNYPKWRNGIVATADTFRLSYYVDVRKAFHDKSVGAVGIAGEIAKSSWGTGPNAVLATRALLANRSARRSTWRRRVG